MGSKDNTPGKKTLCKVKISEASCTKLFNNPIKQTSVEIKPVWLPLINIALQVENNNYSTLNKIEISSLSCS